MWFWVDRLGATLIDASLAALALSSVVALAMLGCRQPARRVRLARAGLLGLLAILPMAACSPLPRFEVIAALRASGLLDHPYLGLGRFAPEPVVSSGLIRPGLALRRGLDDPEGPCPARPLTLFYLSGVACGLGWLAFGFCGLGWLTRRSGPPSRRALDLYDSLPYAASGARPRFRIAPRLRGPALIGPLRPVILVPSGLDRPELASELRLGLLHELAHAEAADPWFSLVGSLSQALWFTLPTVWWVRRQMRLDQEFLADRRASVMFGPMPTYASSLLDLSAPTARTSAATPGESERAGGAETALFQRVLMLVHCPFAVEFLPPRWWSWMMSGLVVAATLAASTLSLRSTSSGPMPPTAATASGVYRISRIVLPAKTGGHQGRAPLFELSMRLPEHFELTVDVWGDPETLAQTRVVGHPLEFPSGPHDSLEDWHKVRVRRDSQGVTLWIDGQATPIDPRRGTTTTWLSVEASAGHPGYFQDLCLSW